MDNIFNTNEYKLSRKAYVTQCTAEHLIGLLVADAFLAELLSYIGLSDALVGIISSFATLAFLFQMLSVFLVQSKFSTKKMVLVADVFSQLLCAFIFFVPFIPINGEAKKILVAGSIMVAQAFKCTITSLYFKWANSYVQPELRATFSAKKECISLITGIVFSAVMGFVVDRLEGLDNISGGLLFIAVVMMVINIINFISLCAIKDETVDARQSMRVSLGEVVHHIKNNKIFRNYTWVTLIAAFGAGMITGFVGVYKTKDLAISLFVIQIINIIADFMRMGASMPIAKYSAKFGFERGIELSWWMKTIAFAIMIFTVPSTWWLVIIYTFLVNMSLAASYQNSFNIGYTLLPQKYMVQAMAIVNTSTGLVSFFAAVVGGNILNFVQANENCILGVHIYGQQVLSAVAFIFGVVSLVMGHKLVVKPIQTMKR